MAVYIWGMSNVCIHDISTMKAINIDVQRYMQIVIYQLLKVERCYL